MQICRLENNNGDSNKNLIISSLNDDESDDDEDMRDMAGRMYSAAGIDVSRSVYFEIAIFHF